MGEYATSQKKLIGCDNCKLIQNIGNWEIELDLENSLIKETNNPD